MIFSSKLKVVQSHSNQSSENQKNNEDNNYDAVYAVELVTPDTRTPLYCTSGMVEFLLGTLWCGKEPETRLSNFLQQSYPKWTMEMQQTSIKQLLARLFQSCSYFVRNCNHIK